MKMLCIFAVLSLCTLASGDSSPSKVKEVKEESYHVRVEEHKMVSKNGKSREQTTVSERNKENGKKESSSSQTTEVIRFPNGTIQRKVMSNGGGVKPECASNEQCSKSQYCDKLMHQCKDCIQQFGCFNDNQCCDGAYCIMGTCHKKTGDQDAPCSKNSECNSGLHCVQGFFNALVCKPFKEVKLGDSCQKQLLGPDLVCAEGLECQRGFGFFPEHKCVKKGNVEDKPARLYGFYRDWGSPFDDEDNDF